MFQETDILFLYVETPLHAGTGSGLGAVDLPIQRERVTAYPVVQASSIKGVLRGLAGQEAGETSQKVVTTFGPIGENAQDHAGAFSPGDARLLLFPVRSLLGIFAWTTCRHVLNRFRRDADFTDLSLDWSILDKPDNGKAWVGKDNDISADSQVVLEEFAFEVESKEAVTTIATWLAKNALPKGGEYEYWREMLPKRLIILPEDDFREFTRFSTEVVTRVRLEQKTKTVEPGALWTEENLPADTLLYAPVYSTDPRGETKPDGWQAADILKFVRDTIPRRAQIGGNETIGRGIVALRWANHSGSEANDA